MKQAKTKPSLEKEIEMKDRAFINCKECNRVMENDLSKKEGICRDCYSSEFNIGLREGIKQGYAKALSKIKQMIKERYNELEILEFISKQELKND